MLLRVGKDGWMRRSTNGSEYGPSLPRWYCSKWTNASHEKEYCHYCTLNKAKLEYIENVDDRWDRCFDYRRLALL